MMASLRNFWPAWAWAILILILCCIPGKELPQWEWADFLSLDKPVHMAMFGLLSLFIYAGFLRQHGSNAIRSKYVALALIISTLYGAATEVMQGTLLVDRYADPLDQVANMLGIAVAWIMIAKGIGLKYWAPKT